MALLATACGRLKYVSPQASIAAPKAPHPADCRSQNAERRVMTGILTSIGRPGSHLRRDETRAGRDEPAGLPDRTFANPVVVWLTWPRALVGTVRPEPGCRSDPGHRRRLSAVRDAHPAARAWLGAQR